MPRLDEPTAVRYNRDEPTDTKFRGLGLGAGGGGGIDFDEVEIYKADHQYSVSNLSLVMYNLRALNDIRVSTIHWAGGYSSGTWNTDQVVEAQILNSDRSQILASKVYPDPEFVSTSNSPIVLFEFDVAPTFLTDQEFWIGYFVHEVLGGASNRVLTSASFVNADNILPLECYTSNDAINPGLQEPIESYDFLGELGPRGLILGQVIPE